MTKKELQVWHCRLLNGDEILCQIKKQDNETITVLDALVVDEVKNNETGHSSIFLSKYTLTAEDTLCLKSNHIITMTKVAPEIRDYYKHSVEYSRNYIEPQKLVEISKVSSMLASINKPNDVIILKTSNNYSYSPSSNSIN